MWCGYLVCATFIGLGLLSTTHPTNAVSMLQSFELDMDTGALVLTFSEAVNANTLDPTQVTLQDSASSTTVTLMLSNATTTTSSNGPVITLQLQSDTDRIKASTELATSRVNTYLSLTATAIQDISGSPVVPVPPSNALRVSIFTEDTTPPELLSFTLDLDIGSLELTFSEAVNISALDPTGITLQSHLTSPILDFTLTGGSAVAVSFTEIMLVLSTDDANALRRMQGLATSVVDTYLALTSDIILDYNGNPVLPISPSAAFQATQFIADTPPEAVSFPVFDLDTGMFSISFSEPVDASSANIIQFTLYNDRSFAATASYTLTGGSIPSPDSSVLVIYLANIDLNQIKRRQNLCTSISNCIPAFTSDFVSDLTGNPVNALSPQLSQPFEMFVQDTTPPLLQQFSLDMNTGVLTLFFSEPVNGNTFDPSQLTLQSSHTSSAVNYTFSDVYAASSSVTISSVIALRLAASDTDGIKASTEVATSTGNTFLSLTANTIQDVSGSLVDPIPPSNAIQVVTFTVDTTQPVLVSFWLDLNIGFLQLTFSEAVDPSTLDFTGITLQSSSTLPTTIFTLTGGSAVAVSFTEMMVVLATDDANALRRMQGLATLVADTYLALTSATIQDYSGNSLVPIPSSNALRATQFIVDTPPEVVSFPVFDLDAGMFSISFSEPVDASSANITQFTLYNDRSSTATASYTLTSSITSSPDDSVLVIYLANIDLNQIKRRQNLCTGITNCIPAFTSDFVSDLAGNPVNALSPQLSQPFETFVQDTTPPLLQQFSLDMNTGVLTLFFSEPVNGNTFDPTQLTLQSSHTSSAVNFTLSDVYAASSSVTISSMIALRLTPSDTDGIKASTQLATFVGNTFLSLTASTIQDISGSPVDPVPPSIAIQVATFTPDFTQPELLSFGLDLDVGSLQLTFSEAVDTSTLDPTGITLQSSPAPALTSFTLTGGSAVAVSFTEIMLVLTRVDTNVLRQLQSLATSVADTYLALTSATIWDYNGNAVMSIPSSSAVMALEFIPVTLPSLEYYNLYFIRSTSYLVLVFSEAVDLSSFDVTAMTVQNVPGPANTNYTFTGSDPQGSGSGHATPANTNYTFTGSDPQGSGSGHATGASSVVNVTISEGDMAALEGIPDLASSCNNTFLSFTSDIVSDIGGNPAEEVTTDDALQAFKVNDVHCKHPGPVTGVQITIINSTAVLIQWNPAQLGDREEISTYSIHYHIAGGAVVIVNVSRSETAVTIRGLNPSEQYVFQVTVTAAINDELVDGEQAEAPLIIQLPTQSALGCPFEYDIWNILWGFTEPGTSPMQPCGRTLLGNVSRVCYETATWAEPDVSDCQSRQFQGLKETAEELFSKGSVNISAALDLVDVLTEATAPDTNMRSLFPSDLNTTNVILTGAIDSLIDDFNQTGTADPEQSVSIVDVINNVLYEENQVGWEVLQQSDVGSQAILNNAERYAIFAAKARNETAENVTISRDNIVLQARQVAADRSRNFDDIYFPTMDELGNTRFDVQQSPGRIKIPGVLLAERAQQSHTIPVANILFRNLELFLPNSLKVVVSNGSTLVPKSSIISSQVGTQSGDSQALLEDPVEINFILRLGENDTNPRCVFWDFGDTLGNGAWSTEGLQRTDNKTNDAIIQCNSTHLTSFAILVNVGGSVETTDDRVLEFITYIGCGVSVVCLLFSIVFFLTAGKNLFQKPHNFIHLNLCVALLLGYGLFIGGTDFARHIPWLCTTVAALLHYLFLAVFCWMLCEGIMLFLMLVIVFSTLAKRRWFFLLIGWGLPLVFVAVGLGVRLDQYGTPNYCWISTDVNGVIWFFVGPMLAIILVNVVILILVLIRLFKSLKGRVARAQMKDDKSWMKKQIKIAKKLVVASIAVLPLLGITWVLGLFAVNENTLVFAYLFTVFNSLQGFFIFFFYVLRDKRLCGKRKFCSCCRGNTHVQVSTRGTGISIRKDTTLNRKLLSDNSAPESPQERVEKVELSMSESPSQPLCPADQAV